MFGIDPKKLRSLARVHPLTLATLGALVVGFLAGRTYLHAWFSYEVFALSLAGFGALALAAATRGETKISSETLQASLSQAEASSRQAEVSREILLASLRPVLIETDKAITFDREHNGMTVRLRNDGSGPAFMREVRMCWYDRGRAIGNPAIYTGIPSPFTVATGGVVVLAFDLGGIGKTRLTYLLDELQRFWVEADYRDVTDQQLETVKTEFRYMSQLGRWVLADIQHYALGSEGQHEPGRANIG